jgi:hypothetical protein
VKTRFLHAACCAALVLSVVATAGAEVKRKRYTFDLNPKIRAASIMKAKTLAKQEFLRDYLAGKFSPEITNRYAEDIDIALTPPDRFLTKFDVIAEDTESKPGQVVLTVEGEVDTAAMIAALVQGDVLSFGADPPKIMMMPSPRFGADYPVEPVRALVYDQIKQAGLRPVDYTQTKENVSVQIRKGGQLAPNDVKVLARQATVYNADFLVYVDIDPQVKPYSQGGYIADPDLLYTIVRPNANEILGEGAVTARGNGSSPKLAFNSALDQVAPVFATDMLGRLYQSIYEASDVITDQVQLANQIELTIDEARPEQIRAVLDRLKAMGANVDLAAGSGSGMVSHFNIEIPMDDEQLYEQLNGLRLSAAGREFRTPVVFFAENRVEIEVVPVNAQPRRAAAPRPKPRATGLARNNGRSGTGGGFGGAGGSRGTTGGPEVATKAKVLLKLKPAKFGAS